MSIDTTETSLKQDISTIKTDASNVIGTAAADLTKTYSGLTLAIAIGVALAVGLILGHVL